MLSIYKEALLNNTQHYLSDFHSSTDERGWTPLHVASSAGKLDIAKYLTSKKASLEELTPTGYTALHLSAMNGHQAVMMVLAATGMPLSSKTVDEQTPLHLSAMR